MKLVIILLLFLPICIASDFKTLLPGINNFAMGMFEIFVQEEEGNWIFSPISVHLGLVLLHEGSTGATKETIEDILSLKDPGSTPETYYKLMNSFHDGDDTRLVIKLENQIFYDMKTILSSRFHSESYLYFNAECLPLNFSNVVETADMINYWIWSTTNGDLDELLSHQRFSPEDRLMLASNAYLSGEWFFYFDEEKTSKEEFFVDAENIVLVDMMHAKGKFGMKYDPLLELQILELPFVDVRTAMYIIAQVNENNIFDGDVEQFTQYNWQSILDDGSFDVINVDLSLPKFTVKYVTDLRNIFSKCTLGILFDPEECNFSDMFRKSSIKDQPNMHLDKFIHNIALSVNENGVQTEKIEGLLVRDTKEAEESYKMEVNRPFYFVITNVVNDFKTVLFIGKISNPNKET